MYLERFNLPGHRGDLLVGAPGPGPAAAPQVGGPFAAARRNYFKAMLQKGHMYKFSCNPSVVLYIAENKTLAGREDRTYEGEALGRKLAVVFFEEMGESLVKRVHTENQGMQQSLLSLAELLRNVGGIDVPDDPARTAAQTEVLLESHYEDLEILRFDCHAEVAAHESHVYRLDGEVNAEVALTTELAPEHRTKMVLARLLQRNGEFLADETLRGVWNKTEADLKGRAAHLLDLPAVPAAPAGRGKGKGKGRGRGRGKGKARGRGAPAAPGP